MQICGSVKILQPSYERTNLSAALALRTKILSMSSLVWRYFQSALVPSAVIGLSSGLYLLGASVLAQLVLGVLMVLAYLLIALFRRKLDRVHPERTASAQRVASARERAAARILESQVPAPVSSLVASLDMRERRRRYTEGKAAAAALYVLQKSNLDAQRLAAAEATALEVEPAIFTSPPAIQGTAMSDETCAAAKQGTEIATAESRAKVVSPANEVFTVEASSATTLLAATDVEPLRPKLGERQRRYADESAEAAAPYAGQTPNWEAQKLAAAVAAASQAEAASATQSPLPAEQVNAVALMHEFSWAGVTTTPLAEALVGEEAQRDPAYPEALRIPAGIDSSAQRVVSPVQLPQQASTTLVDAASTMSAEGARPGALEQIAPVTIGEIVRYSLQTGTVLQVAYAYGSRPGEQRPLLVVAIAGDSTSFLAFEPPGDECKTYITHRILWASDDQSRKASNCALQELHTKYMERQKQLALATKAALTGIPSVLPGCKFELAPGARHRRWKAGVFFIAVKDEFNIASVHTREQQGAEQVCCAMHLMHEWSESKVWDVLGGILKTQFYWVEWLKYQSALEKEGRVLISQAAQPWDPRYVGSTLRPLEEDEQDVFLNRTRLFETKDLHLDNMFDLAMRVDAAALSEYLTETRGVNPKNSLRRAVLTPEALAELKRVGLIVPAAQTMPLAELLEHVKVAEITVLLKERGVVLKGAKRPALVAYLAERTDPTIEAQLRAVPSLAKQYVFSAPPGMSWDDLQNFRTCYVAMLRALKRWLTGEMSGAAVAKFF